jgi:hypothetical protein
VKLPPEVADRGNIGKDLMELRRFYGNWAGG